MSFEDFVREGWCRESGKSPSRCNSVIAKEVILVPSEKANSLNEPSTTSNKQVSNVLYLEHD